MRVLPFAVLLSTAALATPPLPPPEAKVAEIARDVDPSQMRRTIEKLVSFGTRHTLSSQTDPKRGIGAAVRWAEAQMKSFGPARRFRPATPSPAGASRRRPRCATRSPSSAAPSGPTTW